MKIEISLNPGEVLDMTIGSRDVDRQEPSMSTEESYRARVWMRRVLSEFRDNYVDTNPVFRQLASAGQQILARYKAAA